MKDDGKTFLDLLAELVWESWRDGTKTRRKKTYRLVRRIADEAGQPRPTDEECERIYQGERGRP